MIFKNLFKAKWQNKDSNVRITAIKDQLSPSDAAQGDILLQLAAQDESQLVRRAALIKLNSFTQWLSASKDNSENKIREFAQKQVTDIVLGKHAITLSVEQKIAYLENASSTAMIENWLGLESDARLIIALYQKLNKPFLLSVVFAQKQNQQVQEFLASQTEQVSILEKLSKKAVNEHVAELLSSKLQNIAEQAQRPIKLRKKIQLTLSKLLALKDTPHYSVFLTRRAELLEQWDQHQLGFICLPETERSSFLDKKQAIEIQLEKIFLPKQEAYAQQQIADKLLMEKQQAKLSLDQQVHALSQQVSQSIIDKVELDQVLFNENLVAFGEQVSQSPLNGDEQQVYNKQSADLQKKIAQLPAINQALVDAEQIIGQFDDIIKPEHISGLNQAQTQFDECLVKWKQVTKVAGDILPDAIGLAYREKIQQWRADLKPLIEEQKKQGHFVQNKLPELKRLLDSGKYNACFGIFKRINKVYADLSPGQQHRLERDVEFVTKKMADLSDWEHYIATPRKKQLLQDVLDLVDNPLDNPNELAAKVKQSRKIWMSLGHADDDLDKGLNQEFNLACEKAFAPCRLYYAEQEQLREQHLSNRQLILEQVSELATKLDTGSDTGSDKRQVDFKWLDGQLNKLNQQWQDAGEVERGKYQLLKQQYAKIVQPIKAAIRKFHDDNSDSKNALVAKARLELDNQDIFAAIESVKKLQTTWREIGYAGPRHENKLWQSFREVNDQLFKKRDQRKDQQAEEQLGLVSDFEQKLASIKQATASATDKPMCLNERQNATDLLEQVLQAKPVIKHIAHALDTLLADIDNKVKQIDTQAQSQQWIQLFELLTAMANGELAGATLIEHASYRQLSPFWQKKVNEQLQLNGQVDRDEKTLELEILAGMESPAALAQARMQVQVKMMQQQMSSGTGGNLQDSFIAWLQLGQLGEKDLALLSRVKPIFCA